MSDIEDDVQAFLRYYHEVIRLRGVDQALQEAVEDCVRHRRKYADYLCKMQEFEARLAEVEAQAAAMREVLQDALPVVELGWRCPTCKRAVPESEVIFWERHEVCGTHLTPVNPEEWRKRAEAALAADAGRETAERLRRLEAVAGVAEPVYQAVERAWEQVYPALYAATEDFVELRERLKALRALKGGDDNAGTDT